LSYEVIRSIIDQAFTPKDRDDEWQVFFGPNTSSGYDFLLLIENPTTQVNYQLELGIMEDGRLCGQITPDKGSNGPDAMVVFDLSENAARISDNNGRQQIVIGNEPTELDQPPSGHSDESGQGFY
jgi:hypothetical protein